MMEHSGLIEIIPNPKEMEVYEEFAGQNALGFEYNDFYVPDLLDDKEELEKRIALYQGLHRERGRDTLHGAFFDIVPFSWDSGIRRHSIYRMQQSVEIAGRLGCRAVIFHTGLMPGLVKDKKYRANWLASMADTVRMLLRQDGTLQVYCENMFDASPSELSDLAAELDGEERFGICLDIGHVMLTTEEPMPWFEALAPYIRHFHINDNHFKQDEHLALGCGSIAWDYIFRLMDQYCLWDRSVLLEVRGMEKIRKSREYLQQYAKAGIH